MLFDGTSYVEDVRTDGSAAAGLLFWRYARPAVVGALISGTMADELHFANCQDGRADRITTVDTGDDGDDGVAFVNYASGPAATGGLATGPATRPRNVTKHPRNPKHHYPGPRQRPTRTTVRHEL